MTPRLSRPLSWPHLLAYAAPSVSLALLGLPLAVYLPPFWSGQMGLSLASVGLVLASVRLLDVVFDPTIGRVSDRLRSRFGRRRPVIAAGVPVGLVGGALLFFPRQGAGALDLFAGYALVTLAWSMISLPWQAWGAELSPEYGERTRIAAWRETGTLLGVAASAIVPAALGLVQPDAILHVLAVMTCVLALPSLVWLLRGVPEPVLRVAAAPASIGVALRAAWANLPFRLLLGAWLVNGVANGLPAVLFVLLCRDLLRAPEATGQLLLAYFLAGIAFVPFWTWLARRLGKHRAWAVAMLWSSAAFLPVLLLGPGDVWLFGAVCLASGAGLGADLALPPAMQADVVELDEANSGEQRAGLFFAAWTMAQKAGTALAAGVGLGVLGLVGFQAGGEHDAVQLDTLIVLYCLVPVLLKLGAVRLVWRFPIDAAEQARIRARILVPRAAA